MTLATRITTTGREDKERLHRLFAQAGHIAGLGPCASVEITGPIYESYHSRLFLGALGGQRVLIKCNYLPGTNDFDPEGAHELYDTLVQLNRQDATRTFNVPRAFQLFADDAVVVQSWTEGRPLDRVLTDLRVSNSDARKHMRAAGEWLGRYHTFFGITREPKNMPKMAQEIATGAANAGARGSAIAAAAQTLQRAAERIGDRPQPKARLHADFKPSNLILNDNGLTGIDFHPTEIAVVHFDLAQFVNSTALDATALRRPSLAVTGNRLHEAFFEGYQGAAERIDPVLLSFYLAYNLARQMLFEAEDGIHGARQAVKWWLMTRLLAARVRALERALR